MGEIVKFPIMEKRWDSIEPHVRNLLVKNGAPVEASKEVMAWAKQLFEKSCSVPPVVIYDPKEAQQFVDMLQKQKIELFFEALKLKILTHCA